MLFAIKQIALVIINNLFYENIRGFVYLSKLIKQSATDEEVYKLVDTFKLDYLEGGWEILICVNRAACLFANIAGWIFVSRDSPMYFRVTRVWPVIYLMYVAFDKISQRFKGAYEYWMILMIFWLGMISINTSLSFEKYTFNEMWIISISLCQFCSIFMCLSWKKLIVVFWVIMLLLLILTTMKYDHVTIHLYVSILTICLMFPVTTMFYWIKFKQTILLVKTNKELTHTIRTILQVFPEGVIIRSLDDVSKNTITKFANDVSKNILNWDAQIEKSLKEFKVQPVNSIDKNSNKNQDQTLILSDFLNKQELKLDNNSNQKFVEQLVELKK